MLKQIKSDKVVSDVMDRKESYFHWLQGKTGLSGPLSSYLADTEFVSIDGLDDVLMRKAKEELRREYADDIGERNNLDDKDIEALYKSVRGPVCIFEIMACLAITVSEMFEDREPAYFFELMLKNTGLDIYDEEDLDHYPVEVREYWRIHVDLILKRLYDYTGDGGLFPIGSAEESYTDRAKISLWQQMNDWVDLHTNEDGEWVD